MASSSSSLLSIAVVVVFVGLLVPSTSGFWFQLSPNGEKCFYEEMVQDIMVGDTNADFSFAVRVKDPRNSVIWSTDIGAGASFGVKVDLPGRYSVCMLDLSGYGGLVELELTTGAAAQDYSDVAKKDHLEPLALSLRKSTDLVKDVNSKLKTIESRRDRHEATAEDTHSALAFTSSITVVIVILLGVLQIYALRSFLRKKKVID